VTIKSAGNVDDPRRRLVVGGIAGAVAAAILPGCGGVGLKSVPEGSGTKGSVSIDPLGVPSGMKPLSHGEMAWATEFLAENLSVDVHCHPGMFFFAGMTPEHPALQKMAAASGFQARTVADMGVGQCSAGLFSTVADLPLIGARKGGLYAHREFKEGEAYQNHTRQLQALEQMVSSGLVVRALSPDDLLAAKKEGRTAAVFASEGGDFLEENIDRLAEAWQAGIRSIGLVHYHVNHIGDIQTASPVHNGLTAFGKRAVVEMNRLGIIVDLAHATYETTRDAIEASSKPVLVSHSFLADDSIQNPRLLSTDHARMVAESGGLIGSWPTGIGNPDFSSFIDRTLALVDLVGIDHVGLGTDMDANYMPVFTNYRQMPYLPATLKKRGMAEGEIAKLLGGNFMRLFTEVTH